MKHIRNSITVCILFFTKVSIFAANPIITTMFTADPAALVYQDTVFLYTGHDEAPIGEKAYVMHDWHVFSSTDMVHWTDRGACLSVKDFSWALDHAYAGQCVYRDGKFYWYVPMEHKKDSVSNGGFAIGVAVSDSPTGPFTDAIGKALITNEMTTDKTHSWDDIDPTIFIDNNGQAYLYWGNKSCRYIKLKANMIEIDGSITVVTLTNFEEAPWLYKRNDTYYLVYASLFPEYVDYATSTSPTGPWTYRGRIADRAYNCTTIHPAVIDYHGVSYFFYHNGALPTGGNYRRSICLDYLHYNSDGTIKKVIQTTGGVNPVTSASRLGRAPLPGHFMLNQNFSNPFNPATQIDYSIPQRIYISLKVLHLLGQEVATLFEDIHRPGDYESTFNGRDLSSGIYFYQLKAGKFVDTKKLILLK
jgi:hypothetical protein